MVTSFSATPETNPATVFCIAVTNFAFLVASAMMVGPCVPRSTVMLPPTTSLALVVAPALVVPALVVVAALVVAPAVVVAPAWVVVAATVVAAPGH